MGDMNIKILHHNFSLDLSAAFDIVNVKLMLTRLWIIGLPTDMVKLIEKWLKERYVSINGL